MGAPEEGNVQIAPFETERYYARYEFTTPHPLSVSDCESVTVSELLELAGMTPDALGGLRLSYTESQGHPALREAIAAEYASVSPDEVVVLGSPVEGIYLTMRTLLESDDQAVVLAPAYDALLNVTEHVCDRVRRWPLRPEEGRWTLDWAALEAAVTGKTRLLVVNFPHNPTGFLPTAAEFDSMVDFARQRDLWLFCDEMYRGLELDDDPLPSAADRYERSVVLAGLSKAHGLPGLRAGWLVVKDPATREALVNWKHYTTICPPGPTEQLALAGLKAGPKLVARNRGIIRDNLALAEPFFARQRDQFAWRPPQAGSVALAEIDVPSATEYCHRLAQQAGLMLLPAAFMGAEDRFVRFGFGRRSFPEALRAYASWLE